MNNRNNQFLLGVIVFLVGFFCLFQKFIGIDIISLSFVALGFAFILLYRTKRKSWSLLIGAYLMYFGLNEVLLSATSQFMSLNVFIDSLFYGIFFMVPGVVFLILFYDKNKNGLLIPGSILVAFSINRIITELFLDIRGTAFYLIMGICFYYIYSAGRYFLGRWPLYLSGIMLFLFATRLWTLF